MEKNNLLRKKTMLFKVVKVPKSNYHDKKEKISELKLNSSFMPMNIYENQLTSLINTNKINTEDFSAKISMGWSDIPNLTFEKIIQIYMKKDEIDLKKSDFIFKLIFYDNPNAVILSYSEAKSNNIQFYEKRYLGKLKRIFVQTIQVIEPIVEINSNKESHQIYRQMLSDLIDYNQIRISQKKEISLVERFFEEFGDSWDTFEEIAIEVIRDKYSFNDINSYIYLYLYDNLRKLKDQKTIDHLRSKLKDSPFGERNLTKFSQEMMKYYTKRQDILLRSLVIVKNYKETKWTEENSLIEILMTSLIFHKIESFREIDLTQHYISDNIATVFSAIKWCKKLEKLILNSNKIGEEGMWHLGRVVIFNKSLKEIDISLNLLTDDAIRAFTKSNLHSNVKTSTPFTKLYLTNNTTLTPDCGTHIAKIIETSPNLRTLNLSKNSIEDKGYEPICQTYLNIINNGKSSLETLILYSTKLGALALRQLAVVLKNPNCTLKSLTLSENKFELESGLEFFNSLNQNTSLEELILINCDIGNELGQAIYKMLTKNNSLVILNLYNNRIDCPRLFKDMLKIFSNVDESRHNEKEIKLKGCFDLKLNDMGKYFNLDNKKDSALNKIDNFNSQHFEYINSISEVPTKQKNEFKKSLKYLDLSKNKCKVTIDDEMIHIIENMQLDSLDISQNFDFPLPDEIMSKNFRNSITRIQEKTKIIY